MALILHLSDLHLGALADEVTGDYKSAGIPSNEREGRLSLVRSSLSALAAKLTDEGKQLDAVVVSGDVAVKHDESGFERLDLALSSLNAQRPPAAHVVVVPGNHDVKKGTLPSSVERYELFMRSVRDKGYVTPLLDGIDIDEHGVLKADAPSPLLHANDRSCLLVAMNSANYSMSTAPLSRVSPEDLEQLKTGGDPKVIAVLEELAEFQNQDVARISPGQLEALKRVLLEFSAAKRGEAPVRILVLHHQLLPVSESEEFKPFETLSNLEALRTFIRTNDIALVLHGHKHSAQVYLDHTHRLREVDAGTHEFEEAPATLVSSVGAVGNEFRPGSEIGRLVEVDASFSAIRKLTISYVPILSAGGMYSGEPFRRLARVARRRESIPGSSSLSVFEGETVDEVYEQLVVRFEDFPATKQLTNVVCRIDEGKTALSMPKYYSDMAEGADQSWFDDLVEWWQRSEPPRRQHLFNHGSRILKFGGRINQVQHAIEALLNAPTTTRAIISVLDPLLDFDRAKRGYRFPSFTTVHFTLAPDSRRVDCRGFFRKQQMRIWWPVNACELAQLQAKVVAGLRSSDFGPAVPGEIVTISAVAIAGTNRPRALVPKIDRIAEDDPKQLWSLAFELAEGRSAGLEVIERYLADWRPTNVMDPDGVPIALDGLELMSFALAVVGEQRGKELVVELGKEIHDLLLLNEDYADFQEEAKDPARLELRHRRWCEQALRVIGRVQGIATQLSAGQQ